ncbi:MAG: hypothetical protein AAF799_19640 [Myxococcota bacterium]
MMISAHRWIGAAAALCLLAVPACDDAKKDAKKEAAPAKADADKAGAKDEAKDAKADADKTADDAKAEPKADDAKAEAKPEADAGAISKIGVPECDEYIEVMRACFENEAGVPAEQRAAQKEGFETTVKGWSEAIKANPDAKAGLSVGCNAARQAAERAYPGCFTK